MDIEQAQLLIEDTFENPFDKLRYIYFVNNLLNNIDDSSFVYKGNKIRDAYKDYIHALERIGKFSDGDKTIDVLIVTLRKDTSLDRARTMQRNFIAWYLVNSEGGQMKDAALVAFVSPSENDWRFSLIKMEYQFEQTKTGSIKVKEEFTPAKRWSFLVGQNEKSHTAQKQLVKILANDEYAPTFDELGKAFDIETVSKEFFEKYRELFLNTKEELDNIVNKDKKIKDDFTTHNINTVDFVKKLLGQILFLYFIQKKGWLGVHKDNEWGTGSKQFIRELFEEKHANYKNFFNDIMEPIFYEALRMDRTHEDGYFSQFDCKIPFLNGGLFDPIGNYDWARTDIVLPDKLFSNSIRTKEGDIGNGILDVFDRYNFTVKEDEPLEKEVAIDPELLGKAYEKFNAIRPDNYDEYKKALKSSKKGEENKFNKKYGVYYTPRDVVYYMCQQSLANYLSTELKDKLTKKEIESLIHCGEYVSENEARVKREGRETKTYYYKLPESIRKNATIIDKKLEIITVCDPAVGSGAFPVGMMSEIVRTRNVLSTFIQNKKCTTYEFKRHCIEHSLYGVDIDPGAVEIAKLRLWLSLVVDEEDIKNIKPLPNLDYRIMQGNSLISEFMSINFNTKKGKTNENLIFKDETNEQINSYQRKKDEFLNESNITRKTKLNDEIEDLLIEIFETRLKNQKADYFKRLERIDDKYSILPNKKQRDERIKNEKGKLYKESGLNLESMEKQLKDFTSGRQIKPFFLWNLYFSEVFHSKGGFDVVIANPPYGIVYDINIKAIYVERYETFKRNNDIYVAFYQCGISLLKQGGDLIYISPNTFLNGDYYKTLREYITDHTIIREIRDYKELPVFEDPTVFVSIISLCKERAIEYPYQVLLSIANKSIKNFQSLVFPIRGKSSSEFKPQNQILDKILERSIFLLDEFYFVKDVGFNYWTKGKGKKRDGKSIGDRVFYSGNAINTKDIPFLTGRNVEKWRIKTPNNYLKHNFDHFLNPQVDTFRYSENYLSIKPKIVYRQTANTIIAAIDYDGNYLNKTLHLIVPRNNWLIQPEVLLALLNSKLFAYLYSYISQEKEGRVFAQVKTTYIKKLPIPKDINSDKIISIIKKILISIKENPDTDITELEKKIDQFVYKIYGLTPEEIKIVEGNT